MDSAATLLSVTTPESIPRVAIFLGLDGIYPDERLGIECVESLQDVLTYLDHYEVKVVVLGPRAERPAICSILGLIATQVRGPLAIVIGFGAGSEFLQEFVDSGRVFYISRDCPSAAHLRSLVAAAVRHHDSISARDNLYKSASKIPTGHVLEYCIRLSHQTDKTSICDLLVEAVRKVVIVDRAHIALYDADKDSISWLDADRNQESIDSAASGLTAFVARTGECIQLESVGSDPRYDSEADNPNGCNDDRFVALPILGVGAIPVCIVVAIRAPSETTFSVDDVASLVLLIESAAPPLNSALLRERLEGLIVEETRVTDVFSREALDHYTSRAENEGALIRTAPSWLKNAHWFCVAFLLSSLAFLTVAQVKETATGVAVVRARDKTTVTVENNSLVRGVYVSAGDRVQQGDTLARFEDTRSGTNRSTEQLRAPAGGVVGDVRIRVGQRLSAGDEVASIVDEDSEYGVIVLLPGQYAPQIRRGMQGFITIDGYPESHEPVTIDNVDSEVLGPRDAIRDADIGDAIAVTSPVVLMRCTLKSKRFAAQGRYYAYHDGMSARLELDLRSESMLADLVPGLKSFVRTLR